MCPLPDSDGRSWLLADRLIHYYEVLYMHCTTQTLLFCEKSLCFYTHVQVSRVGHMDTLSKRVGVSDSAGKKTRKGFL